MAIKLRPRDVDQLVRGKNCTYHKWRSEHTYSRIADTCTEVLMVFGALPRWEEGVAARRAGNFQLYDACWAEQREWRNEVRSWCLVNGVTRFPNQSAQFLKFYFAWYRFEYERINGASERKYARQMM